MSCSSRSAISAVEIRYRRPGRAVLRAQARLGDLALALVAQARDGAPEPGGDELEHDALLVRRRRRRPRTRARASRRGRGRPGRRARAARRRPATRGRRRGCRSGRPCRASARRRSRRTARGCAPAGDRAPRPRAARRRRGRAGPTAARAAAARHGLRADRSSPLHGAEAYPPSVIARTLRPGLRRPRRCGRVARDAPARPARRRRARAARDRRGRTAAARTDRGVVRRRTSSYDAHPGLPTATAALDDAPDRCRKQPGIEPLGRLPAGAALRRRGSSTRWPGPRCASPPRDRRRAEGRARRGPLRPQGHPAGVAPGHPGGWPAVARPPRSAPGRRIEVRVTLPGAGQGPLPLAAAARSRSARRVRRAGEASLRQAAGATRRAPESAGAGRRRRGADRGARTRRQRTGHDRRRRSAGLAGVDRTPRSGDDAGAARRSAAGGASRVQRPGEPVKRCGRRGGRRRAPRACPRTIPTRPGGRAAGPRACGGPSGARGRSAAAAAARRGRGPGPPGRPRRAARRPARRPRPARWRGRAPSVACR